MLESMYFTPTPESLNIDDIGPLLNRFNNLIDSSSVRTKSVLKLLQLDGEDKWDFLYRFSTMPVKEFASYPNCGRKTIKEILLIQRDVQKYVKNDLDFFEFSSDFNKILSRYSARTNHVLMTLRDCFVDNESFLKYFESMSPKAVLSLKNCGEKTKSEILDIQKALFPPKMEESSIFPFPSNIDTLLPLVSFRIETLSERARNGLKNFLKEHNDSLSEVYLIITSTSFSPLKVKNIGQGTAQEVVRFFDYFKAFIDSFKDEDSVRDQLSDFSSKLLAEMGIPKDKQDYILAMGKDLGYFPLFAAIDAYIDGLSESDQIIVEGSLRIKSSWDNENGNEVASILGLSRERVRQKRNRLIKRFEVFFSNIGLLSLLKKNPYSYQMVRADEYINNTEGTHFSLDFINWALGCVFDEVTVLGDTYKTITDLKNANRFLCLVPTELCQYMDFSAFIEDIETRLAEKRIEEVKVSLQNLINSHLKTLYCEDERSAIEMACRSILFLHYPVEVDFGQVIFNPNARKNNPLVIEEIIRAAGHPMTLEEIYEEFVYLYPERAMNEKNTLRGSVQNNPNIIPIGRSSTYSLKGWVNGTERGGTIRDFVCEYLDSLETPIAAVKDIFNYVRKFRPNSSEKSIASNLFQDKNHRFAIFIRNGIRYYGYSDRCYDNSFKNLTLCRAPKQSFDDKMRFLEEFILKNKHYPYYSYSSEEERQLYRFVNNVRSAYLKNSLPFLEKERWRLLEEKYQEYDMQRYRKRRSDNCIEGSDNV